MSSMTRVLLLLSMFALAGAGNSAHITDKLLVGMYAEAGTEGTPLRLLPSGTPLEVLRRQGAFAEVRLADDTHGWVEATYITEEKPAKAMLLEAQARLRELGLELDRLKSDGGAVDGAAGVAEGPPPSAREAQLRQSLGEAESRIAELEKRLAEQPPAAVAQQQLDDLQDRVQAALGLLADAQGMELRAAGSPPKQGLFGRYQSWIIGLIAAALGFGGGIALIDYRIRKRYGGFRI